MSATIQAQQNGEILAFAGRLETQDLAPIWGTATAAAAARRGQKLTLDLSAVEGCDTAGATLLVAVEAAHGAPLDLLGANDKTKDLIARARSATHAPRTQAGERLPWLARVGQWGVAAFGAVGDGVAYIGEGVMSGLRLLRKPGEIRFADAMDQADQAGMRAIPLVIMLGFLVGLILAFQSAIPMRRFGADLFVPNLVAVSLLRELGPLLTAVVLAGRTGSAFAAEIGTMKVNEEIDAMTVMGLNPMLMLVVPRMIAAMIVMPVLTLVMEAAGLVGMGTVMVGFGLPVVTIVNQVTNFVTVTDFLGGIFKAVCFGTAIAAIGCRAGLSTGVGPRAVGLSTTGAVVGGIVAIVLLDGVFSLLFFKLDL